MRNLVKRAGLFLALASGLYGCAGSGMAQVDGGPPMVFAPDGKYLGDLDGNPYNRNSISNPYGKYGTPYGNTVTNPYGKYGAPESPYSPNFEYGRGNRRGQ